MIKIGDLVRWELIEWQYWFAIVVEEPYSDSKETLILIKWVTGRYIGEEDYIAVKDLEVIA
jgi:hypothetical protein